MSALLTVATAHPRPADYARWRAELTGCACGPCTRLAGAASDVLDYAGRRQLVAAVVLLEVLRAGQHQHRSYAQAAGDARAHAIATGTYGRTVGRFTTGSLDGLGAGMTPTTRRPR